MWLQPQPLNIKQWQEKVNEGVCYGKGHSKSTAENGQSYGWSPWMDISHVKNKEPPSYAS